MNISLIIPSYNTEKHLINTYNSVRKYYKDVEMVIINDGSTDNTSEWLDSLKDDNVIKINSKERKGHTFFYDEVKEKANLPHELTGMDLRRTAITQMVEAGSDQFEIMQVSGHSSPNSVTPYLVNTFTGATNALAKRWSNIDE